MHKICLAIIFTLLMTSCVLQKNPPLQDLDFVYKTILENHPGIYNQEDPEFRSKLDKAYLIAQDQIQKKIDSKEEIFANFTATFEDSHLGINFCKKNTIGNKLQSQTFSLAEITPDLLWIKVPTFALNSEQKTDLQRLLIQISHHKNNKYILFDLRGNQGGNSEYASQIIDSLFGQDYANYQRNQKQAKVFIDWRASPGNLQYLLSLLEQSPNHPWLYKLIQAMQKSIEGGQVFYREKEVDSYNIGKNVPSSFDYTILIIIDAFNVSAALNFIDECKMMTKNVILIGQKTKADRLYMDVQVLPLPSGTGQFFFPMKVFRNRLRPDNEPYYPDIKFDALDNDKSLQDFILKIIQTKKQ